MKNILRIMLSSLLFAFTMLSANAFPDVAPDHWAAKQIEELSSAGIIVGYPDGTFQPDENVTRAEFASMAIKALGQQNITVAQPVNFEDITPEFWAYDAIQKALYFDLISVQQEGGNFRPDDSVSRAESIAMAVNALTTEDISKEKATEVLSKKYKDISNVPEWFLIPAGKAEILNMMVVIPTGNRNNIEAARPATRAEVAAILYRMIEEARLNPNAKLAEVMRKKTGEGYVIENATVQGSVGTIPAGTIVPVLLSKSISSQTNKSGDIYVATAPQNYVTPDKYILIYEGSNLKGQLLDVRKGKWFVRNGVLVLENALVVTNNDQTASFCASGEITKQRNWFMNIVRKTLKGEKLDAPAQGTVYVRLLKPIKVDLTNGWIIE